MRVHQVIWDSKFSINGNIIIFIIVITQFPYMVNLRSHFPGRGTSHIVKNHRGIK